MASSSYFSVLVTAVLAMILAGLDPVCCDSTLDNIHPEKLEQTMRGRMIQEQNFLKLANNLKKVRRHSWPSGFEDCRESVADHSWRLALMVLLYGNQLDQPIDLLKSLKMALIHDLPESITGDIPVMEQTSQVKKMKEENELVAMKNLTGQLGIDSAKELWEVWREYEEQKSYESKFVKALDKIEAYLQHNEDPLNTWTDKEKEMRFQDKYLKKYVEFDSFLTILGNEAVQDGINKLIDGGEDIDAIKKNISEQRKDEL